MGTNNKQERSGPSGSSQNWFSILVEKNSTGVIVGILIFLTLIALISYSIILGRVQSEYKADNVSVGFISILSMLSGFFVAELKK